MTFRGSPEDGSLRPNQVHEAFVRLFQKLSARSADRCAVITFNRRIAASPAAKRVHVLGYRGDAPALTAACDVFVLPSTKREGLARSLIEAMAYGVAPVVTDCGGSPELVVNGVCGLVVPVRDVAALAAAIRRLHDDPELRKRLGAAARERIRNDFRIEDTIAKTLVLYHDLVAEHERRP